MPIRQTRRFFEILRNDGLGAALETTNRFVLEKTPLGSKHPTLVKLNSRTAYWRNRLSYSAPARPFETIRIEAADVEYNARISYSRGLGRVEGGDWDERGDLTPVDDYPTFEGLKQRFERGEDWEDTAYVKDATERIRAGETPYGCDTVGEFVDERCAYVEDLFTEIGENGYRPQSEHEHPNGPGSSPHGLEPVVTISRDGEIHFANSGKHRFAIAQILDLRIPCHVAVRHERWQSFRDEMYESERTDGHGEPNTHPDLEDVI